MSDIEQYPFDALVIPGRDSKSLLPGVLVVIEGPKTLPEHLIGTRILDESLVPQDSRKISGIITALGEVSVCADSSIGIPLFGNNT